MKWITYKPYRTIWATIPFVFLISLFRAKPVMDIPLHDTYFVVSALHASMTTSIFLALIGTLYWLIRNIKSIKWITALHLFFTIFTSLLLQTIDSVLSQNGEFNIDKMNRVLLWIIIIFIATILVQVFFLFNVIVSAMRDETKPSI